MKWLIAGLTAYFVVGLLIVVANSQVPGTSRVTWLWVEQVGNTRSISKLKLEGKCYLWFSEHQMFNAALHIQEVTCP